MTTLRQLVRYGMVGAASNTVGYLLYLASTAAGLAPALAMSTVFALGVMQTFFFNKRWTFGHAGASRPVFARYCLVYAGCYVVNLLTLHVFVDRLGHPHQIVQGIMVVVIAALVFVAQKLWVFRPTARAVEAGHHE